MPTGIFFSFPFLNFFLLILFNFFFQEEDPNMNQHIDYYYYDSGGYSDRQGDFYNTDENLTPTTEYIHTNYYDYDQDMEQRIRDIRKNDAIFR